MSTDSARSSPGQQCGQQKLDIPAREDYDIITRPDTPVSVKAMTLLPSKETATDSDYFARDPASVDVYSQHALSSTSTAGRSPPRASSKEHVMGSITPPEGGTSSVSPASASLQQNGARTVGHSPAATPGNGLFMPSARASTQGGWESPETPGTYRSPCQHLTHKQVPKETHEADVDVDLISGRKLINHYEIIDELGRGTHGKIKLGRDLRTPNMYVAIKIVERCPRRRRWGNAEDQVKKEVAVLKKARHPAIVALVEVIDDPSRRKVYIVLEFVEHGEIEWRVKAPKEIAMVEARRYEREKRLNCDNNCDPEDLAVVAEAQSRLRRRKRAILQNHLRTEEQASANPYIWSHETHGDASSGDEEVDSLSPVLTAKAEHSPKDPANDKLTTIAARRSRGFKIPFLLPPMPRKQEAEEYLAFAAERQTKEPDTLTPSTLTDSVDDTVRGLSKTNYEPYDPSSGDPFGGAGLANHILSHASPTQHSPDDNLQAAAEALHSDHDPELQYVPCMTLQNVRVAFRDTLLGLQYLHYQGIVHRDIKPPNLLQTIEHRVKISDFGASYLGRPLHDEEAGEEVVSEATDLDDEAKELAKTLGTPAFFAPELCITEPTNGTPPVTKAIDVWALGITLFCMLYARTPHVDNEFVVMRKTANEEIYIPRRRLQPVTQCSRPSSQTRVFPLPNSGRRGEFDMVYEDINDDLYDLLKRLLIKDPRERITLEEVRHHPWVVADLPDKPKWLEETDINRQSKGKKIEVSDEDVKTAVMPLQWVERVRSGIKRFGERLGFGCSKDQRKERSGSSAGLSGDNAPTAASPSSSMIRQDARRQNLRGDESIFRALKASREGGHPLSESAAAAPDSPKQKMGFSESRAPRVESMARAVEKPSSVQPSPLERLKTTLPTAGSTHSVRQSDINFHLRESPPPSPGLPDTPTTLESPGGLQLGGLFGDAGRRILDPVGERCAAGSAASDVRGRSTDKHPAESLR